MHIKRCYSPSTNITLRKRYYMEKKNGLNIVKLYFIYTLVALFNFSVNAEEHNHSGLELSPIADLSHATLKNESWQAVLPIPGNDKQYFIATSIGNVYQINDRDISPSPFFELKSALNTPENITLTAIALDPNFNYRERDGYLTFYTAHTEKNKKSKTKLSPENDISLPYDTVIMRWQLTYTRDQRPQLNKQREVMRIAINQAQEHIQQLSFNPYIEPWHNDFGLLFVGLAKSEKLAHEALYAGTILRIKPKAYGVRGYSTPVNNPFSKQASILNEIVFIAGKKIIHFDWIKKGSYSLLVQLQHQDNHLLVKAKIGEDWRKNIPQEQIKQQLASIDSPRKTFLYHGRELKSLWGKVLHLQTTEDIWQLQASPLFPEFTNTETDQQGPFNLEPESKIKQTKFSLHQRLDGELMLLEHNKQRLYSLKQPQIAPSKTINNESSATNTNSGNAFAFIAFTVLMLISYFWYLRKRTHKQQHFLHEQWANFDIVPEKKSIKLYKRHEKNAEKVIEILSLTRSELLLNDNVISTVDAHSAQSFSNTLETQVLAIFAKENQLKMIDEKQRKIQLRLTNTQAETYLFCLYFRVGNIRHTKLKYSKVINKVIDWQWLFSQYIHPTTTSKRKIKVNVETPKPTEPSTTPISTAPDSATDSATDINANKVTQSTEISDQDTSHYNTAPQGQSHKSNNDYVDADTRLIAALDKLVMMKKQGYLDESEFNMAKSKILKDLASESRTPSSKR